MLSARNTIAKCRTQARTLWAYKAPVQKRAWLTTSAGPLHTIPRLIITDQPGFAADIARTLRLATLDKNVERGFFGSLESNRDIVTWCFPNSFQIVDPVVVPKNWKLDQLPYFPALDAVSPSSPESAESMREIVDMMRSAEMVICAMEPTSEGQLLFHDLLTYAREHLNVRIPDSKLYRIWPHVRTKESVRLALKNPFPNARFKALAKSAHTRRYIDWTTQYNYSKLYTLLYSRHSAQIFQLGRIPLMLLKQVTERYLERREFQPKVSYEVHLECVIQGQAIPFKWTKDTSNLVPYDESESNVNDDSTTTPSASHTAFGTPGLGGSAQNLENTTLDHRSNALTRKGTRHNATDSKQEATKIAEKAEPVSTVVSTRADTIRQPPPLLYNLTSLQREAYERYSIPGSATHVAVIALYEKFGLITNPNTSSHQVPLSKVKDIENIFRYFSGLKKYSAHTRADIMAEKIASQDARIFDASLEPYETHAIIPIVTSLSGAKRDASMTTTMSIVYDMIVRRFLAVMMPDMEHSVITVMLENADEYYFEAKAATLKLEGWKAVGALPKAKSPFNPGPANFPSGYIPSTTHEEEEAYWEDIVEQKTLYKTLSQLRMGDELRCVIPATVAPKETSPPPLYTQSRVMALMEDKAVLVAGQLKYEAGLGTPDARADILTRLMSAKWFRTRQDRYLEPSRKGILLTKLIQDDAITDPTHSHSWDNTLSLISRGRGSSSQSLIKRFRSVIEPDILKHIVAPNDATQSSELTPDGQHQPNQLLQGQPQPPHHHLEVAYDLIFYHTNPLAARALNEAPLLATTRCPKCNSKGHLKQGPSAYFCAAPKCNFSMPQIIDQRLITLEEAKTLLQRKPLDSASGLIDSGGNTYDATLMLQPPHFNVQITNKTITKKAESKPSAKGGDSNPLLMRRRRLLGESLGSSRIVSVLSGPGRPTRGTSVVKTPKEPLPRGRPKLSEEVIAERIKEKVDKQIIRAMARQAKVDAEKDRRENPIEAPEIRIDGTGNIVRRRGRPRVGEFVPKKDTANRPVGRPRIAPEELERREKLKRPRGRPSKLDLMRRMQASAQDKDSSL